MALARRIIFYLLGVGLGCVLVVFILKQKNGGKNVEYCYLPNCRVLKELRSKPLVLTETLQGSDTTGVMRALREGDVEFDRSSPRLEPCGEYWIEWEQKEMQVANCSTEVKILAFKNLP
jgi:hypothetical protein